MGSGSTTSLSTISSIPSGLRLSRSPPVNKRPSSSEHEVFYLHEKVDLSKVDSLLDSHGMVDLKINDRDKWKQIASTCMVARSLGGYVPVCYYMHESQDGYGRMKSRVDATGVSAVPYVRMGREARAVLAGDLYWDVDMVNCQPSFLSQKCQQYKIKSPLLDRYVTDREASLTEVMDACGVTREDAKNLFIRLIFLGSVDAWTTDCGLEVDRNLVPVWIHALKKELRESIEHECVSALVHEVHGHHYSVGGIIYDGILVDKCGCMPIPDDDLLLLLETGVSRRTGYTIKLAVKPLSPSPHWTTPPPLQDTSNNAEYEDWMNGAELLSYDEVKCNWEKSAFKIINQVVYMRINGQGIRHVTSEKTLQEAFRHLGYVDITLRDSGSVSECTDYILNWIAQIFQQPAQKTGGAILLKGEEGVGKNRATDLLRAMVGADKFLQTATPANTLYGRFNRQREGRFLIVVNESNGHDNFAANDVIKDMITCDQFECESKGVNAYTMQCFSRFIFTTNNDNCLRVNPDNRRYVIIETSSVLKGNTEYFNHLSGLIDDAESRVAFYKFLMARDIKGVEWIRSRPATTYMSQMVSMNLPYEHQFILHMIQGLSVEHNNVVDSIIDYSPSVSIKAETLFDQFNDWLSTIRASDKHETNLIKFGLKVSKLVRDDTKNLGLRGISKNRTNTGAVYYFCIKDVLDAMSEKMRFD
eukprot:gene2677-biopygen8697